MLSNISYSSGKVGHVHDPFDFWIVLFAKIMKPKKVSKFFNIKEWLKFEKQIIL